MLYSDVIFGTTGLTENNLEEYQSTTTSTMLSSLQNQIEQCRNALSEQQRLLARTRDEAVRATAMRSTGLMLQQLDGLIKTARQLERDLQAQATEQDRLRALQEVGAAINSSLDLEIVLQQVMDAIIQLTRAERAMLLLNNNGKLEVKMARNLSGETLDEITSLEISRSIVRQVAESGEAIVTINAQEDERFASQDSIVSYKLRSILCAPLKIKGETIGVLYADNRIASGIFSDADRDLLAGFADQAAVAIDNARLFHEVADIKQLLDNVFASINSGVITFDDGDRITLFNRAAARILSVSSESFPLLSPVDTLSSLGLPIGQLIRQVREDGNTRVTEIDLAAGDHRTHPATIHLTISPLHTVDDERLGGVAIVLDDVSEKKRIESLRRYLPPALVDQVRDLDAAQKPQRRAITVLFADIRGFSRLGEHLSPEELIDLANSFFTEAVAAISKHHGLIDKFMGDAVMALFNTPLNPQPDHVTLAVDAALAIQAGLENYHSSMPTGKTLHFGIGIHTGEAVVGNVGGEQRKDYSAVGDVVNLCKRLQELAGPNQIIISRDVYNRVSGDILTESLPPVYVRGRQTREDVFRLLGRVDWS